MRVLRRRILAFAFLALACQLLSVCTPAASLLAATHGEAVVCTCDMTSGHHNAFCPMHRSPNAPPDTSPGMSPGISGISSDAEADDVDCHLTGTPTATLDLFFAHGVLPPPSQMAPPRRDGGVLLGLVSQLQTRSAAVDPPPPRL
jgi:hypothetical protein